MVTHIKGHRIGHEEIGREHMNPNSKLEERDISLNYPTHDNSGDLTVEQKNSLTSGGNCDNLHYHTGGGGGPQGIYTNEQRDAELLKLSLALNAQVHGMDKSIRNNLEDDSTIDYGLKPAKTPQLEVLEDGGYISGGTNYTYGISYTNKRGETDIRNISSIKTNKGVSNAIKINIDEVPEGAERYKVYRTDGTVNQTVDTFDGEFIGDTQIVNYIDKNDKIDGEGALYLKTVSGTGQTNLINKKEFIGNQAKTVYTFDKNKKNEYIIKTTFKSGTNLTNRIDIIWGPEHALVPSDYDIYCLRLRDVDHASEQVWEKIPFGGFAKDRYGNRLQIFTDGEFDGISVVGNTNNINSFYLDNSYSEIFAIKLVVKKAREYKLYDIRYINRAAENGSMLFKKLPQPVLLEGYNSIELVSKCKNSYNKAIEEVHLLDNSEEAIEPVVVHNYNRSSSGYVGPITIRSFLTSSSTIKENNRIRFTFEVEEGKHIKFNNCFFTTVTGVNSTSVSKTTTFIPVTFGGKLEYDGIPESTQIVSDWCFYKAPDEGFYSCLSWSLISGKMFLANSGNGYGPGVSDTNYYLPGLENLDNFDEYSYRSFNYGMHTKTEVYKANDIVINNKEMNSSVVGDKWQYSKIIDNIDSSKKSTSYDEMVVISALSYSNAGEFKVDSLKLANNLVLNTTALESSAFTNHAYVTDTDYTNFSTSKKNIYEASPAMFGVSLDEESAVNCISLACVSDSMIDDFYIQYSNEESASVNEHSSSDNWKNVSNVSVIVENKGRLFDGIVEENKVTGFKSTAGTIGYIKFDSVNALKFRIIITKAQKEDGTVSIQGFKAYKLGDVDKLKTIYSDNVVGDRIEFIDEGYPEQNIYPTEENTTGSVNIKYSEDLDIVSVANPDREGVLYFKEITLPMYQKILLETQHLGNVKTFVSNDGVEFIEVEKGKVYDLTTQSEKLTIKCVLNGADSKLYSIGILHTL